MYRYIFSIVLFIVIGISAQSQHFDSMYSDRDTKTWKDSGWYFLPQLTLYQITDLQMNSGIYSANINFRSTDMSSLMFTGQATIFFREEDIPVDVELEVGKRGFATVLFPEDLLFCPSPDAEQDMGQDDPYLPLSLAGRIERIGQILLDNPIQSSVQLNDFTVN